VPKELLPDSIEDPGQRIPVPSACPSAELLVGRKYALRACGGKRNARVALHAIQGANKGGFVVAQHGHGFRETTVVGLINVPPVGLTVETTPVPGPVVGSSAPTGATWDRAS
jgi:hypothetical protein